MTPVRLRLSRARGFDLQALSHSTNGMPALKVTRPGRWGNPFTIGDCRDAGWRGTDEQIAARCKAAFAAWLTSPSWRVNWDGPESERRRAAILSAMPALRGKNLACWCALDAPCHADVLLALANRPICEAIP